MDQIESFTDARQRSWCIHCTGWLVEADTNRDHVPTKALLREPYPTNLPVVETCVACNSSFSADEEYVAAFLGAVLSGSTNPQMQPNPKTAAILRGNSKLRREIEACKTIDESLWGERRTLWTPDNGRINRIILKNARGHVFFEYGEPMLEEPACVWTRPLVSFTKAERVEFENPPPPVSWPEIGSRMMTRLMSGQDLDGSWVTVQDDIYRYAITHHDGIRVRTVLSEYLATEAYWES